MHICTCNSWTVVQAKLNCSVLNLWVCECTWRTNFNHTHTQETLDSLSDLYSSLGESDLWVGLWMERSRFPETAVAIAYESQGLFEQAQESYESVIGRARDLHNISTAPPSVLPEYKLWEDHWCRCARELGQWDTLNEFGKSQNGANPFLGECVCVCLSLCEIIIVQQRYLCTCMCLTRFASFGECLEGTRLDSHEGSFNTGWAYLFWELLCQAKPAAWVPSPLLSRWTETECSGEADWGGQYSGHQAVEEAATHRVTCSRTSPPAVPADHGATGGDDHS